MNKLSAKASAGLSAAEITKITGVSSYEGVPNIAYDDGMGAVTYLFGRGSGPLTIKMVNAVIDYAGLPASNHVTKADYPFLPEQ